MTVAKSDQGRLRRATPSAGIDPMRRTVVAAGAAFTLLPVAALAATPQATGLRLGLHGARARIVLDLDTAVDWKVFTLADPYRIVIDLSELGWSLAGEGLPQPGGLIRGLRYGLFEPGTSRMVVDLADPAAIDRAFLLEPQGGFGWRLVIDLTATTADAFVADLDRVVASNQTTPERPTDGQGLARHAGRRPVIVLDPGHGGRDPGAIGASNIHEKAVTLAMARELRARLEATGRYEVALTRDSDRSMRLRDRVATARQSGGDLFISLHADSLGDSRVRGASVYTLSETASDAEAAALARRENKADLIGNLDIGQEAPEVTGILIDLVQRETMNLSARFATRLVAELQQSVKLLRNTHRFAGFVVLKAPDVPSVLLEMGFLSNPEDEHLLRQQAYRAKLAAAVVRAVDGHFAAIQQAERT